MAGELKFDPSTGKLRYDPSTGQLVYTCGSGIVVPSCTVCSDPGNPGIGGGPIPLSITVFFPAGFFTSTVGLACPANMCQNLNGTSIVLPLTAGTLGYSDGSGGGCACIDYWYVDNWVVPCVCSADQAIYVCFTSNGKVLLVFSDLVAFACDNSQPTFLSYWEATLPLAADSLPDCSSQTILLSNVLGDFGTGNCNFDNTKQITLSW